MYMLNTAETCSWLWISVNKLCWTVSYWSLYILHFIALHYFNFIFCYFHRGCNYSCRPRISEPSQTIRVSTVRLCCAFYWPDTVGRDSSVGIATGYGLDGPGIESRWEARFSPPIQTGPGAHPAPYTMGTGSFPRVKRSGRGVDHPPPHLAPRLKKE